MEKDQNENGKKKMYSEKKIICEERKIVFCVECMCVLRPSGNSENKKIERNNKIVYIFPSVYKT